MGGILRLVGIGCLGIGVDDDALRHLDARTGR
jgi:hypothetical protein